MTEEEIKNALGAKNVLGIEELTAHYLENVNAMKAYRAALEQCEMALIIYADSMDKADSRPAKEALATARKVLGK